MDAKLSVWSAYYVEMSPEDAVLELKKHGIVCSELSDEHGLMLLQRGEPKEVGKRHMKKITQKILTKLPIRYNMTGLISVILLFIYGVVGSILIMKLNLIDSIYYSVITMATVGYGDYTPHTGIQKIFATTLAIGGVGLLAYVFNVILTNVQEKMSKYSKGARKMQAIKNMDNYYIICGFGRVGKVVFKELESRNQNIIIIEKDEEICKTVEESSNVVVINKDAIENDFIAKLANEKCRSVIICTGNDVDNLFIVLTIRETNPDAWIVTRASKLENIKRLKKAGADKIVSPEIIGGQDLYFQSTKPHLFRSRIWSAACSRTYRVTSG